LADEIAFVCQVQRMLEERRDGSQTLKSRIP
jgi:hypothetical protein